MRTRFIAAFRKWRALAIVALLSYAAAPLSAAAIGEPLLWPEAQRAFFQDGPGWLLGEAEREALLAADEDGRQSIIDRFFATDPVPSTPSNELVEAVNSRRRLVESELLTYLDDRARLLFLHGAPVERRPIDCDQTFVPLEIWWYGDVKTTRGYVLYEPQPDKPYRLWLPLDSKQVLYGHEMSYWLQQIEELRGIVRAPRFDKILCKDVKIVDEATGVVGLYGFDKDRPDNEEILGLLEPPADLSQWAEAVAETEPQDTARRLLADAPRVFFPERDDQRMVVRLLLNVPEEAGLQVYTENEETEVRIKVDGLVERDGDIFEDFHTRFQVPVDGDVGALALVIDRLLRPDDEFLVRLRIIDEISQSSTTKAIAFRVPSEPDPPGTLPDELAVAVGVDVAPERVAKPDTLIIIPPYTDVVLGLWTADLLITGERIQKVAFLVDGKTQMTRSRPPFQAELRLSKYPTETVIRVEGYDERGDLVAWDEVILNQQRGQLEVKISNPKKGDSVSGEVLAEAHVVVPEEEVVTRFEFLVNDEVVATLRRPPWQALIDLPEAAGAGLNYLTAAVYLEDGTRAEDVRFLNQPEYLEEVDVDFVELYTSVDGDDGRELEQSLFSVFEDNRPQQIRKFELVRDLPITIGITLDTSGSMIEALGEAKRTALDFLDNIITPRDQSFAVSFSNRPGLIMPRTSDVGAVEEALEGLQAVGNTALYDAVVTSLYYFRSVKGRRALILLSDGEDTASSIEYKDALEYARRSGVAIYTIGLNIPRTSMGVRGKLKELSDETGGRSFFISKAVELVGVYGEIERELRSQYLLAYLSDAPQDSEGFRGVEVKMKGRLKARTISGYYP